MEYFPTEISIPDDITDEDEISDYISDVTGYDYWLTGWLCALLGRRIGDVVGFRWSTLFKPNGTFQDRLETLKEEKTGKVVKALINECAHVIIKEYIDIM